MKCGKCRRDIPAELLSPMQTNLGFTSSICGICALNLSNEVLGAKRTKFNGEMAEALRQGAIEHYKKTNQK